MGPKCKTCTHVSYQQMSILTLNFNTSFVGNLTNVATLEYFTLTVLFFVFVERCFSCLAWVHRTFHVVGSFDENTRFFFCHDMLFSWIPRKLVSLVLLLSGRQRLDICQTRGSEPLCLFVVSLFTLPCLSQCFWKQYRED